MYKKDLGIAARNSCYYDYKSNAKRRGFLFDITIKEFECLTKKNCHYCGVEPKQVYIKPHMNGEYVYNGIDRVDNSLGYLTSNIVACCGICNIAKNNLSYDAFKLWIKRLIDFNADL